MHCEPKPRKYHVIPDQPCERNSRSSLHTRLAPPRLPCPLLATIDLVTEKLQDNPAALFSVLATRVQLGQPSLSLASQVVSQSYALLVRSTNDYAQVVHIPDPVCARLAMCMMDADWSVKTEVDDVSVQGRDPKWWVEQMCSLFSQAQCRPEKGDVGEIFVAMYLLLSADILRKRHDGTYRTFSVNVIEWLQLLVNGGEEKEPVVTQVELDGEETKGEKKVESLGVSFIQV